jgi:hypothetical protein
VRGANAKLVEELQALTWQDERRLKENPLCENHCADMHLYGWRECRGFMHVTPPKKPPPGTPEADDEQEREDAEAERREIEEEDEWEENLS